MCEKKLWLSCFSVLFEWYTCISWCLSQRNRNWDSVESNGRGEGKEIWGFGKPNRDEMEKTCIFLQLYYIISRVFVELFSWENEKFSGKKREEKKNMLQHKMNFYFLLYTKKLIWMYLENMKQEKINVKISYTRKNWSRRKYIWSFCRIQKNSTKQPLSHEN